MKVLHISVWSPSVQNSLPPPSTRGEMGDDCFEVGGGGGGVVRTRYSLMRSSPPGLFRLSFGTLISRKWKPCVWRRLWPCPSKGSFLYVLAPSFFHLVVMLMLSANSILFLGRRLLI